MPHEERTPYAGETNGLYDPTGYHREVTGKIQRSVPWTTPGLRITRLRLVSDPGFPAWDLSYCHGEIDGEPVRVTLPFFQLPKRGTRRAIVEAGKEDGVFAKGTGIFDAISTIQ